MAISYPEKTTVSITGKPEYPSDSELRGLRNTTVTRLLPGVYQQLEKKHTRLVVHSSSTAIEVAFQLGVQSVLADLRNGYVVEV